LEATGRRLENALSEWIGGALIGAIPTIIHGLSMLVTDGKVNGGDWVADLAFWVIAMSGNSGIQANFRLSRRKNEDLGRAPGALVALSFVLVALAAFIYGVSVAGVASEFAIWAAVSLLFGSLVSSCICDYVVARRCSEA
jgi:hypothetical protein